MKNSSCFDNSLSVTRISWIEVEIEPDFWKSFKCEGEENAVLFLAAGIVPHDSANRGHPVRQITVDGEALFFEDTDCAFVLLLKSKTPVVGDSVVSADHKKAAVFEERVA